MALILASAAQQAQAGLLRQDLCQLAGLRSAGLIALGAGASLAVHPHDEEATKRLTGSAVLERTAPATDALLAGYVVVPATAAAWAAGAAAGSRELEEGGSLLCRVAVYTQAAVGPLKVLAARRRPDGSSRRSFPSGHTANAFALARASHRRYGAAVGVPLYLGAALTAAGRVHSRRHFLSDVVMGAALGAAIGDAVTLEAGGDQGAGMSVRPGARRVYLDWRF
ncbi:MAG: phosphatase PAP2 family protein [Candidatus Latescibacterota bacterium]